MNPIQRERASERENGGRVESFAHIYASNRTATMQKNRYSIPYMFYLFIAGMKSQTKQTEKKQRAEKTTK